jgi:hypothetical protein
MSRWCTGGGRRWDVAAGVAILRSRMSPRVYWPEEAIRYGQMNKFRTDRGAVGVLHTALTVNGITLVVEKNGS